MKCHNCGRELFVGDNYIKCGDKRYCTNCIRQEVVFKYYVADVLIGTDDDGVEEFRHWDSEEAK